MKSFKFLMRVSNNLINRVQKPVTKVTQMPDVIAKKELSKAMGIETDSLCFKIGDLSFSFTELADDTFEFVERAVKNKSGDVINKITDADLIKTTLIGTNRTVYLDTLVANRSKGNSLMLDYIQNGQFSFRDTANVFYKAAKICPDETYIADAHQLIKYGYSIEDVLKIMDKALMDGNRYSEGLMHFVAKYPDKKSLVLLTNSKGEQAFDAILAKNYPSLKRLCKFNDNTIQEVVDCCRMPKGCGAEPSEELYALALKSLKKHKGWSELDKYIFRAIKRASADLNPATNEIDKVLYRRVESMLDEGYTTEQIVSKLNRLGVLRK